MVARAYFHPTIDAIRPTAPKLAARLTRQRGYLGPLEIHALAETAPGDPIVAEDTAGRIYTSTPAGIREVALALSKRSKSRIQLARLFPCPDYL